MKQTELFPSYSDYETLVDYRSKVKNLEDSYFHAFTLKHTYAYYHKSSNSWRVQWKGKNYKFKHIKYLGGSGRKAEAIEVAKEFNEMAEFVLDANKK